MPTSLEHRVIAAVEAALQHSRVVAPISVLTRMGWLRPEHTASWRQGRVPYLERVPVASLGKLTTTLRILRRWAEGNGLQPHETIYVSSTRSRHRLRCTKTGDQNLERAYRTHWISPELSAAKQRHRRKRHETPLGHGPAGHGSTSSEPGGCS